MMAEIFLNALVIAYAIYHTAVTFGWTLLLFDLYNQDDPSGCPESPGLNKLSSICYLKSIKNKFFVIYKLLNVYSYLWLEMS